MFTSAILSTTIFLMCCQSNEYDGIVPLRSTRADVERILGQPVPVPFSPFGARYKTKTREINFSFSRGRCTEAPGNGWDVPRDVVLNIRETFTERVRLNDLKINTSRFKRTADPGIIGSVSYDDDRDGIGITVDPEGYVVSIMYYPARKDLHLRCEHNRIDFNEKYLWE